jgi:pimeloyl-ACP methyl ester carboxylesterase
VSTGSAYRGGHLRAADGLRLAWREYGDALEPRLPVLCLAGLTRNANDFHDLALALAPRRVVTLDLRGRGGSDWDPTGRSYRPEAYLDDVRQALAAKGLGPVVVCGTSLGGYLAMGLGLLAPTALAGVILNDAGPDPDTAALADIARYMADLVDRPPADWASAQAALRGRLTSLGLRSARDWEIFTRGTFVEADGRLRVSWDPGLGRAMARQPRLPDLWPLFGALRPFPTLLLRGGNSPLLRVETVERMRRLHPGLEVVTVPGAGHTPTLLEPESRAPVDDFLQRLDRDGRRHAA